MLVAAGTGPIGEALCCEFARRGLNVVLISKSTLEGMRVSSRLKKEFNVQAIAVKYDFAMLKTQDDVEAFQKTILSKIKGKNIGILVNNVTVSAPP